MQRITHANGLEVLVASERTKLLERVRAGEFGQLELFYTPFERGIVSQAEHVDRYVRKVVSSISWISQYLPVIHIDDSASGTDSTSPNQANAESAGLLVDTGSWMRTLAAYATLSVTTLVKKRVNARVADDFFRRKYAQLQHADTACVQNLASLNMRIEEWEQKQRAFLDKALEVRKSYDQRGIAIAEYEAAKKALNEDDVTCRSAIQGYHDALICNADIDIVSEGVDTTRDMYERSRRLLLVIQQEKYTIAHRLREEKGHLVDEERTLHFLEQAVVIIENGLQALYQNKNMLTANHAQIQRHQLEIEQQRVTYETCEEMYRFAVAVPQPQNSLALIDSIEGGIKQLQSEYMNVFCGGVDSRAPGGG